MTKKLLTQPLSVSRIICSAIGHNYKTTAKITNYISEYKCAHCGKEVTNSFSGNLEALTFKHKQINSNLAKFFEKKMRRMATTHQI